MGTGNTIPDEYLGTRENNIVILLHAGRLGIGIPFLARIRNLSLPQPVQIGSGTHSTSYLMETGGSFAWGKSAGA